MANRCAGLDSTWAHLPAPAPTHAAGRHYYASPARWLCPAAAFENEALTSALRASMSPATVASSFSSQTTPSSSSTSSASELLSGIHDAPAPAPASRPGPPAGPRGGRVSKRRPRPSRRAQTTYITADPPNFRRMVQEITGFPVSSSAGTLVAAAASEPAPATPGWPPAPACVLPTLDTSAFLLDRATTVPVPEEKSSSAGGASATAVPAAAPGADDEPCSSVLQELEAMACAPGLVTDFPTLESWGII